MTGHRTSTVACRRHDRWGPLVGFGLALVVCLLPHQSDACQLPADPNPIAAGVSAYEAPVWPYDVLSGYGDVRHSGVHYALDLWQRDDIVYGLGVPIVSIGRAEVLRLRRPETDPERRGVPYQETELVRRGRRLLPAWLDLEGYGRVDLFTQTLGSSRTGTLVETRLLEGPLQGCTVRYMHLGAIHPDLAVGHVVERQQELGILGGTAVMRSAPHLHIDVGEYRDRRWHPVDFTDFIPPPEVHEEAEHAPEAWAALDGGACYLEADGSVN